MFICNEGKSTRYTIFRELPDGVRKQSSQGKYIPELSA